MNRQIQYLNTDLDLASDENLGDLVGALEARGLVSLHVLFRDEERYWSSTLETGEPFPDPESNIAALLTAIESLDPEHRAKWKECRFREFNIGYDCGDEPRWFHHELTVATLARMVALDISLTLTLYPIAKTPRDA